MKKLELLKIIQNGGATLDKKQKPVHFDKGWQVSQKDCYILDINNINEILQAINTITKTITKNEFCGLWVDNNKIYIDISIKCDSKLFALTIGKIYKQKSVFDWKMGRCLWVNKSKLFRGVNI